MVHAFYTWNILETINRAGKMAHEYFIVNLLHRNSNEQCLSFVLNEQGSRFEKTLLNCMGTIKAQTILHIHTI